MSGRAIIGDAALRAVTFDANLFGRKENIGSHPVVTSTGIVTAIIAERYTARESIDELAEDYGCDRSEVEELV